MMSWSWQRRKKKRLLTNITTVISLSQCSHLICGVNYVWGCFSTLFYHIFWVGLPAYFSNHSPFLREHIFCRFQRVSYSRVLVHCHPSSPAKEAYSFWKSAMGFYVCVVLCVHRHVTSCFKSHPRRLGNAQITDRDRHESVSHMCTQSKRSWHYQRYIHIGWCWEGVNYLQVTRTHSIYKDNLWYYKRKKYLPG